MHSTVRSRMKSMEIGGLGDISEKNICETFSWVTFSKDISLKKYRPRQIQWSFLLKRSLPGLVGQRKSIFMSTSPCYIERRAFLALINTIQPICGRGNISLNFLTPIILKLFICLLGATFAIADKLTGSYLGWF